MRHGSVPCQKGVCERIVHLMGFSYILYYGLIFGEEVYGRSFTESWYHI